GHQPVAAILCYRCFLRHFWKTRIFGATTLRDCRLAHCLGRISPHFAKYCQPLGRVLHGLNTRQFRPVSSLLPPMPLLRAEHAAGAFAALDFSPNEVGAALRLVCCRRNSLIPRSPHRLRSGNRFGRFNNSLSPIRSEEHTSELQSRS